MSRLTPRRGRVSPHVSAAGSASGVLLLCLLAFVPNAGAQPLRVPSPRPPDSAGRELIARGLPRVTYRGGPYLRRPRVVTVTFEGDDPALVSRLEQFGARITRTRWWHEVTEGYCAHGDCIGAGPPGRHVRLAESLPAHVRDADVEELLARAAQAGRLGRLDPDTLLLVYLPAGVALSDAFTPRYCSGGPRAFHRALKVGETKVAYAVLPRCGGEADLTATASHEILEATTNPDPAARGFAFERSSANAGFTAAGVEPVDPCGLLRMGTHQTIESGFVVQRAWSNRRASQGHNPCVPSRAGQPYVALVPRQPVVRLPQEGESATITLNAASDRPAPAWAVAAFDMSSRQGGEQCVEVSLDKSEVTVGQTVDLIITMRGRNAKRLCVVLIVSTLDEHSHVWPVAVIAR